MRCAQEVDEALVSGSVGAFQMPQIDKCRWFVEQHPVGNAVAQRVRYEFYVLCKAGCGIAIGPASSIFQSLRKVPVLERNKRAYSRLKQRIDQSVVIIDSLGARGTGAGRLNARPGNRKAVAV